MGFRRHSFLSSEPCGRFNVDAQCSIDTISDSEATIHGICTLIEAQGTTSGTTSTLTIELIRETLTIADASASSPINSSPQTVDNGASGTSSIPIQTVSVPDTSPSSINATSTSSAPSTALERMVWALALPLFSTFAILVIFVYVFVTPSMAS